MYAAGPRTRGVNPSWGGRGDLGGCRWLGDLGWVIELTHRSSVGLDDLECHTEDICRGQPWGPLKQLGKPHLKPAKSQGQARLA
jgi:hypothetical protein